MKVINERVFHELNENEIIAVGELIYPSVLYKKDSDKIRENHRSLTTQALMKKYLGRVYS